MSGEWSVVSGSKSRLSTHHSPLATLRAHTDWVQAAVFSPDGEVLATTPDIICVMDSESGEAIGTEMIRYGQRVTVIALPPPPLFLTPKGLATVGPRAFGYDFDYRSVLPSASP